MDLKNSGALALLLAGGLISLAAAAHLACIAGGPAVYRVMGAGDRILRAVEAGRLQPTVTTLAVTVVLAAWAAYAFSAAGVIDGLPLARLALPAIRAALIGRALCYPWLKPVFPGNSETFWLVSSAICLGIGALYAWGTAAVWARL
jgi:hypothetical protein